LQNEENNQYDNKQNSNLGSWSAKCGGKSSAGPILVSPVIAATAFPVSSIHMASLNVRMIEERYPGRGTP
jgi:hypothetical protein